MDVKQLYRSIYALVKQLDEHKSRITSIDKIFSDDLESIRRDLIKQSESLIFLNHDTIGRKAREIFWRKGFYDVISLAKRLWTKSATATKPNPSMERKMADFILTAIANFKMIVVKLEADYELNLRYIIDFNLLDNNEMAVAKATASDEFTDEFKFSCETINYVLETIHAMLLSIGDLHRYFIDFKLATTTITRDYAAKYYYEAFKLNPAIGMAQNQLGTLYTGLNYDLDSMYFYLYSLSCVQPFELSENNMLKIFQKNSDYLETMENEQLEVNVNDFIAQFILIVDIFYYDKDVADFNMLCHCALMHMRDLLRSQRRHTVTKSFWFKIIGSLLFCLNKLKSIDSSKKYSLNAFLVAICSVLVDSCIVHLESFIMERDNQNSNFQDNYNRLFQKFDTDVRKSREKHRNGKPEENGKDNLKPIENGHGKMKTSIVDGSVKQESITTESQKSFGSHKEIDPNNKSIQKPSSSSPNATSADGNVRRAAATKLRRRRKKISSYESDSDMSSQSDLSEMEMNSDFSSDDDDDENDMSYGSSFMSSDSEAENDGDVEKSEKYINQKDDSSLDVKSKSIDADSKYTNYSDSDDIIVEEEKIVYKDLNESNGEKVSTNPNADQLCTYFLDPTAELIKNLTNIEMTSLDFCFTDDDKDLVIEEETIIYNNSQKNGIDQMSSEHSGAEIIQSIDKSNCNQMMENEAKPEKLRYKRKYSKIDPNIIVEFANAENTLTALKILFDWLKVNNEILVNCFKSNPEFVHNIMKLLNYFNIDIFTNKVYFERNLLETPNVRENLRSLFDIIGTIPIDEDILLKKFNELHSVQQNLDWEVSLKMAITSNEVDILRIFKLVDFGFFVCKTKKFKYNFCARSRRFTEINTKKERINKGNNGGCGGSSTINNSNRKRHDKRQNYMKKKNDPFKSGHSDRNSNTSNDELATAKDTAIIKKNYLKNRQNNRTVNSTVAEKENLSTENKYEIMGKLWLRNEVKTLESKMRKPITLLTPYLVMDSKSLTEYTAIVKNLMKTKKFIILIPNAVFSELDELKKTSENARNAIRWMEREFSKGSRFLRSQRNQETLPLALLKLPKKLDREAQQFLKIAEFCNYIQKHHSNDDDLLNNHSANEPKTTILTLLTGDHLAVHKSIGFSYTGIMNAMAINFEQITAFYANYKKK